MSMASLLAEVLLGPVQFRNMVDEITRAKAAGQPTRHCGCSDCSALRAKGVPDFDPNEKRPPAATANEDKAAPAPRNHLAEALGGDGTATNNRYVNSIRDYTGQAMKWYRESERCPQVVNVLGMAHADYAKLGMIDRVKRAAEAASENRMHRGVLEELNTLIQTAVSQSREQERHVDRLLTQTVSDAVKAGDLPDVGCYKLECVCGNVLVETTRETTPATLRVKYNNTDPVAIKVT